MKKYIFGNFTFPLVFSFYDNDKGPRQKRRRWGGSILLALVLYPVVLILSGPCRLIRRTVLAVFGLLEVILNQLARTRPRLVTQSLALALLLTNLWLRSIKNICNFV